MKKGLLSFLVLLICSWVNAQTLIAGWTYPSAISGNATSDLGLYSGTMYVDGTNGSSSWTASSEVTSNTGTATINDPRASTSVSQDATFICLTGYTTTSKSIVFKTSTIGYQNINLLYATRRSTSGWTTQTWMYSTDGTTFNSFTGNTVTPGTSYASASVDLSAVTAINNVATLYLKVVFTTASGTGSNNRIDNFQIRSNNATWSGASSTAFATQANWIQTGLNSTYSAVPTSTTDINFNGTPTNNPTIGATATSVKSITYNSGASAIPFSGTNTLTITNGITNSSSNNQTITPPVSLTTNSQTLDGQLTFGGNISVANSLTITVPVTTGNLNIQGNKISFGTSGVININGTFKTSNSNGLSGSSSTAIDNTNSPTINLGASSVIDYNGSSQTITGRTDYRTVNLSASGTKTLGGNATIATSLAFSNSAILDLNGNALTMSGTISGASSSQYIATTSNGTIVRTITSGGGSFVFPIGRNTITYNPVTITNTGASTSIYTVGAASTTYSPSADGANAQWSITSATSTTSTFAFSWTTADAGANLNSSPSSGVVYSYNGSSWATTGGTTSTGTPNVTTQSGITSANTIWTVAMTSVVPDIALADNSGGQVAAGNITRNTTNNIIYNFQLGVTTANATLNSVAFATTNNASDVSNYKLYYASTNSFGSASQIGSSITTGLGTGTHTFSSLTQVINSGATGYFWIVSDVPSGATSGNTIAVTAITTSDITFASGNKTGTTTGGGTQTIIDVPSVTTSAASGIATTSVVLNGTVNANANSTTASFDYGTTISYGTNVVADQSPITGTSNTSISKTITGLGTNTLYNFRAKGVNTAGTTNGSNATFTTLSNAPTVGSGNAETSVGFTANWTAPTNDGSETYTFTVEVDDDNAFGSINATYSGISSGSTSQVVTGLAPSTTFYFRVKAVNAGGSSAWSSTSSGYATLSAVVPTVTTGTVTSSSIVVDGSQIASNNISSDGGSTITARGLVYNTTSPAETGGTLAALGSGTTGSYSQTLSGLSANTLYYVKAYATNGIGTSYGSEISFTTLVAEPTALSTVTFGTKTTTSLVVNFSGGDGTRRVVFVKQGSAVSYTPSDGTSPSGVNASFGSGTQFGTGNYAVYDGIGSSVTITGLTANTTYHIAVYEYNNNNAGVPNYFTTAGTANTTTYNPTITTSVSSISSFGNVIVGSNSASQSYTVNATELSSSVTITAPTGFAISLDDVDYSVNPIVLPKDGSDAVPTTTVYVRFSPGSANGANSGNVTNTATSATTKNVAVSGNAISLESTTEGSISFGTVTGTSIIVNLPTVGNGSNRIIVVKSGSAPTAPTDGTSYTANAAFGSGNTTAVGSYVVYNGTGSGSSLVTVTGLTPSTTYYFAVYEYNVGTGSSQNYLTPSTVTANQKTNAVSSATDQFRTAITGNWNDIATWESYSGSSWIAATLTPDNNASTITIQNGHTVTVTASVSVDEVTVNSGGQITINSGQTLTIADGTGTDLTVNGYIQNIGTLTLTGTGIVNSGGVYEHNRTISSGNLTFPVFTYNTGGKVKVTGTYTYTAGSGPSFPAGTYADVEFDCNVVTADSYIQFSNASTNINGELRITATGSGAILMAESSNTNQTCASFVLTAGNVFINRQASGARSLTVTGNAIINGGELRIKTGTSSAQNAILNVGGDLTLGASGTISNVTTSGSSYINFNGSTAQTFTRTGTLSSGVGIGINNASGVTVSSSITFGDTYGPIFLTLGSITCSGTLTVGATTTITRVAGTFAATPTFAGAVNVTYANTSPITSSKELPSSNVTALSTAGGSALVTLNSNTAVTSTFTVGGGNFTIPSGVSLTISAATSTVSSGKTLTVDGTLNSASITSTGGTINVNNGGVVNVTGASLPICTWNTGSTCVIVATGGSSSLTNGSQNFYNLTWSSSNQSSTLNIGTTTIINGKFLITTTNGNLLRLNNNTSAYSLTVGGDFEIQNGTLEFVGSSGTSGIKELLIAGNFIQSGGTITKNVSGTGTCNIVFNKSGTQTFTKSSGTISNAINFIVNSGSTLDLGTNIIDGSSGTFTLNSGAGIITANTAGITTTGATGSVQVTGTRTYNTGANYTYNAIAAQITGTGLPATVNNLTINNSAGLTLTNGVAVTGALGFTSGSLSLNNKTLTLNGSITGTSSLVGSAASSLSINGTGSLGTINFDQTTDGTTNTLASLTLNRTSSGSATLGNKLVLIDALTPTAGTLNTGGYLHLRSRSTNTARIAAGATSGGYINGDVTVERYMSSANSGVSNRAYRLITPSVTTTNYIRDNWQEGTNNPDVSTNNNPVTHYGTHITGLSGNSAGFDVTQNNSNSLFNYNQTTNAWDAVTNTNATTLDAKKGYLIFIRGSRNSISTINTTTGYTDSVILRAKGSIAQGDQTFALTGVSGDFALVTNPFPAPINWASVYSTNSSNFNNYVTIWDPNQGSRGGYVTVTSGGVTTPGTSALTTNIQTGQAFFVQLNASAPTLNINEAHKSTTNNLNVYRTTANAERLNINLKYTASGAERNADGVTALIDNSYNNAVDGDDAEQIQNWDEDVALLRGNKELSIESRSNANTTDTLFLQTLRLRAAQANYKWEIEPFNIATITEACLIDNFTNTVTPLSLTNNTIINFTVSSNTASLAANRFKIVFKTNASLPVTVTKFTAQLKNNSVQLNWNTVNEQNISTYEVERSVDGRTFTSIATVRASNSSSYNTIDNNPQYGINYYRLKVNEQNGKVNYSNIIQIQVGKQVSTLVTVYPNPIINNVLSVQLVNAAKGSYSISLYNTAGQKVYEKTLEHQGGSSTENLAIGSLLSQGQYQLRITGNNGYQNIETIIKQ